jgi:Skp family chaperone for outer membrane proteins
MSRSLSTVAAACVAMFVAAVSMGQTAGTAPPPTKLAVVNIVHLFDSLDQKADADGEITKTRNAIAEKTRKMTDEVTKLDNELKDPKLFAAGSAEYKKMQDDLLQKSMELQVYTQVSQQQLFLELRLKTMELYNKMNAAIEAHAKANGIALVFVTDDLNLTNTRSQQELQAMVSMRKVVYAHPNFDITNAIIERMNTDYKLGSRK